MRRIAVLLSLAFIVAWLLDASSTLSAQEPRPPNVLMIAVDDLACRLGCYGDPIAKTPNIDRLAASGLCFQHAYCQIPLCNPARASLMTGLRPDRTGVFDLDRHFRDQIPDVVTLPQAFRQAGYRVARVGKIYHYDVPAGIGTDGLDDSPSWEQRVNPSGRDRLVESQIFNAEPHRKISASLSWLADEGTAAEQTDGLVTTAAIELLRQYRDEPFFLAVGFFRPHTPYVAPKSYFDLYPIDTIRLPFAPEDDRVDVPEAAFAHNNPVPDYGLDPGLLLQATQAYYASVSMVDDQVGRLLAELQRLALDDQTIVVFWSDHGYHLGEHGGIWQKRTLFEESARSPLIIRDGRRPPQGDCRRVVEYVDIYPTLADLADIERPTDLDGRSLIPLLTDPLADWDDHAVTQILRPADDRLPEPVMGASLRTDRYRLTLWNGGSAGVELYDHATDPGEFDNLAVDADMSTQQLIDRLTTQLQRFSAFETTGITFNPDRL